MLEPRLKEAQAGGRAVLFVDAAHFVFGAFLGYLWSCVRFWVKAPCGRRRLNVLAALNAISHKLTISSNETYINSASVCELLHAIARQYAGQPVTLVLDNARYQRCRLVQDLAIQLNIELLFLPAYSPNLNLIERYWKFVKKQCLYSQFHADFPAFKNAILKCAETSHITHKQQLASLLTLNFQTFEEAQLVTV
jgi:transposase